MPGCADLALLADAAAGDDDRYEGASDDELIGVLCAWDRVEAHACARQLAPAAELIRRRPQPGCPPEGPARMPAAWEEFTADRYQAITRELGPDAGHRSQRLGPCQPDPHG